MTFSLEDKLHILKMVEKHGVKTTCEIQKIGKSSIYKWQRLYVTSHQDKTILQPKSKRPKTFRQTYNWDRRVIDFIIQERKLHPFLGKDKLLILLQIKAKLETWNTKLPSLSSIGRLLTSLKSNHRIPKEPVPVSYFANTGLIKIKIKKYNKKPRPKKYKQFTIGQRIQIDTVITIKGGIRRYMIQATDIASRYTYSKAYKTISSNSAKEFLIELQNQIPNITKETEVQTDNGTEFMGNFKTYLETNNFKQYWNYVHSPKMNCYVERFNRTIQEEFLNGNKHLLFEDIETFNQQLRNYIFWYNYNRPHHGLDLKTPNQYVRQILG